MPHVTKTNSEYGLDVVKDQHKIFPMTIPKHPIEICCTNTLEIIRKARWQNIAEMRDMLLQLRVALHVSKKQERKMDRSTRDALRRAEKLQLKLNKTLSTVQSTKSFLSKIFSYEQFHLFLYVF